MKKFFLSAFALIFIVLVALQFKTVERENPDVVAEAAFSGPPEVEAILRESCYDCHSNETHWPIYSRIAPISWLVSYDVVEGRKKLNFSEWNTLPMGRQFRNMDKIWEYVESGEMPLRKYVLLHPSARLTEKEKSVLHGWFGPIDDETSGKKDAPEHGD